jgi:hypothetical protein
VSRRSGTNPRYQKDAKTGMTRRSAASAKPKRDVGSAEASGSSSSGKKTPAKSPRMILPNPPTAEFKRWNLLNYVALGVSLVMALIIVTLTYRFGNAIGKAPWMGALWGLWGVGIAASLWIQFSILRKLRIDYVESGQAERDSKEKMAADAAAKRAAAAEEKAAKAEEKAAAQADTAPVEEPEPEAAKAEDGDA